MAKTAQEIFIPTDLDAQQLQRTDETGLTADNIDIFEASDGSFFREIGSRTKHTTIAKIRAMNSPNPNVIYITNDFGIPVTWTYDVTKQTGADNTGETLITSDGKRLKAKINGPLNILQFGADPKGVVDSTDIFNSVLSLPVTQPSIYIPRGVYLISSPLIITTPKRVFGDINYNYFAKAGSCIHYTGEGACFLVQSYRVEIKKLGIYSDSTDDNYQTANAIQIDRGRGILIKDVNISGFSHGIVAEDDDDGVSFLLVDNCSTSSCESGMFFSQGIGYCNAVEVRNPYIRDCNTGIICDGGTGNVLNFGANEVGNNLDIDVELRSGSWALRGPMWSENTAVGIKATGGVHFIESDLRVAPTIVEDGGSIICNSAQIFTNTPFKAINKNSLKFWFSFDEQDGSMAYSRMVDRHLDIDLTKSEWIDSDGPYNTSLRVTDTTVGGNGSAVISAVSDIDLSASWTIILCLKNESGFDTQKALSIYNSADSERIDILAAAGNVRIQNVGVTTITSINMSPRPADLYYNEVGWATLVYDADTNIIYAKTSSGVTGQSDSFTIPDKYAILDRIELCGAYLFDEVIYYSRILDPKEIFAITHQRYLPRNLQVSAPTTNNTLPIKKVDADYAMTNDDCTILADTVAAGESIDITLPDSPVDGQRARVMNSFQSGTGFDINIISGGITLVTKAQHNGAEFQYMESDSTWHGICDLTIS